VGKIGGRTSDGNHPRRTPRDLNTTKYYINLMDLLVLVGRVERINLIGSAQRYRLLLPSDSGGKRRPTTGRSRREEGATSIPRPHATAPVGTVVPRGRFRIRPPGPDRRGENGKGWLTARPRPAGGGGRCLRALSSGVVFARRIVRVPRHGARPSCPGNRRNPNFDHLVCKKRFRSRRFMRASPIGRGCECHATHCFRRSKIGFGRDWHAVCVKKWQ
jgi:hypothetical protein